MLASNKEFLDIQATIDCPFTLKDVRDMYSYRYVLTTKLIWPICVTGWVFAYELSRCRFDSSCSPLNFRIWSFFEKAVSWHSGNCRIWINSETHTWNDKNIKSKSTVQKSTQNSSITWRVWINCWVFDYDLSGFGFESSYTHLNFRFPTCFEQGFYWHSGNYRVWFHSDTGTSHDKNIQSKCTEQISTQNTAQ